MAELKNCSRCNRVFPYFAGVQICQACQKKEEKMFEDASAYIKEHPGVPMTVVAKELDISYDKLMKFIREGRLQIVTPDGKIILFCEKCGNPIDIGRFCPQCENGLLSDLQSSKKDLVTRVDKNNPGKKKSGSFFFINEKNK